MARETGLAAALAEDGEAVSTGSALSVGANASQDDLFGDDVADQCDQIAAPFGLTLPGKGPGRPAGSRNRSTEQTKKLIRAIGGDSQLAAARIVAGGPLLVLRMAQAAHVAAYNCETDDEGRPVDDKNKPIEVMTVSQALATWQRAGEFLGPYLMAKEATKVEIDIDGQPVTIVLPAGVQVEPDISGDRRSSGSRGYSLPDATNSTGYEDDKGEGQTLEGQTGASSD